MVDTGKLVKRLQQATQCGVKLTKKLVDETAQQPLNQPAIVERREREAGVVGALLTTGFHSMTELMAAYAELLREANQEVFHGVQGESKPLPSVHEVKSRREMAKVASYATATHFVNGKMLCRWITDVVCGYHAGLGLAHERILLVIDGCRVQQVREIESLCAEMNIDLLFIPHNQTSHLQALDIAAFGPFRTTLGRFIRNRMRESFIHGRMIKPNAQTHLIDSLHFCAQCVRYEALRKGFDHVSMRQDLSPAVVK